MKKLFQILCLLAFVSSASAYTIGGAYATLIKCEWGNYGYEYGYIGTYNANGRLYSVFFGSKYCEY